MKTIIILFCILLSIKGYTQSHDGSSSIGGGFTLYQSATVGHAYLLDNFSTGNLIDNKGLVSETKMFNYDIFNNKILFKKENSKDEFAIEFENYSGILIKPGNSEKEFLLKKIEGSNFEKNKKETKFYEIVKAPSDKVITEYIKSFKDPNSSGWTSSRNNSKGGNFKLITNIYVLNKENKYTEVSLNEKSILKVFKNKKEEIEKFIKKNKIEIKEPSDLVSIVEYYFTLD